MCCVILELHLVFLFILCLCIDGTYDFVGLLIFFGSVCGYIKRFFIFILKITFGNHIHVLRITVTGSGNQGSFRPQVR
jgi:hypothetical protein